MTTPRRLQRGAKRELAIEEARTAAADYLAEKELLDRVTARVNEKKAALMNLLTQFGEEDDKGHRRIEVDIPGCRSLKRERRVSQSLDTDKVEAWLKGKGLWEEFSYVERVLDVDAVYGAGYEGKIPRKVFEGFTVTSESFAFKIEAK